MRTAEIKTERQFVVTRNRSYNIQNYDTHNDYPEKVADIVSASGTGKSCVHAWARFIYGQGFRPEIGNLVCNDEGQTLNDILKLCKDDYAKFGGCYVHMNWNANYKVTEYYHVPFEHVRFTLPDKETKHWNEVAVHPDWTKRYEDIQKFSKDDIDYIKLFNPTPAAIDTQVERANGWNHYKGQIFMFSVNGFKVYAEPLYSPQLKNMRTEEAIDIAVCRNATSNFMPGIAIVEINNTDESGEQLEETRHYFMEFQGEENVGNIAVLQCNSKEEIPEKLDLTGENYDKAFTVTQEYVPDRIRRIFNIPPCLVGEDVGNNWGADLIRNSYDYYNAVTEEDRQVMERIFKTLLAYWDRDIDLTQVQIVPLSYSVGETIVERIGEAAMKEVIEIVARPESEISDKRKRALLKHGYGLTDIEINELMGINRDNNDSDNGDAQDAESSGSERGRGEASAVLRGSGKTYGIARAWRRFISGGRS